MQFNTIIFDFDGVVVDSERLKFKDLKTLLQKKGIKLSNSSFKEMVGKKTNFFLSSKFGSKLTDKQIREIVNERNKLIHNYKSIPGVKSFIDYLKKKKIRLGLATGTKKALVNKIMKKIGIKNKFSFAITGENFKHSKPNPEVYKKAIKKSKVAPNKTAVIEDSVAGVRSAKKAGLYCIAITTNQNKKDLKEADLVVNSFDNLKKQFERKGLL